MLTKMIVLIQLFWILCPYLLTDGYHGKGGPLSVEDRTWTSHLPEAFVEAGRQLGFQSVDVNGVQQTGMRSLSGLISFLFTRITRD